MAERPHSVVIFLAQAEDLVAAEVARRRLGALVVLIQ